MEPFGNGFGDWNVNWKKWRQGSALTTTTTNTTTPDTSSIGESVRLQPTAL
jgi:hypothetical protein